MADIDGTMPAEPVLDLTPETGLRHLWRALADVAGGCRMWRLGCTLGWLDIKLRYRGSILGPLWLTLSTAVMVAAIGSVYGALFHMDLHHYLPFLSISLVLWGYVSGIAGDGCQVFTRAASLIQAARLPFTVHAIRSVVRNTLILLHNLAVIIVVFAIFRLMPAHLLAEIPVLALWAVDSLALSLALGVLGTRFRDIPPIVASVVQIAFFVTPIMWEPGLILAGRQYMLLNPFYPLFEILRGPVMGEVPRLSVWIAAGGYSILLWVITLLLFSRLRSRLAYWV
ncbi:ABC transporter permease [Gluconacetobacter tumulisoli]|nr:ABC transporter permease [Gluconacetobacter tumulisoli]